MKMGSGTHRFEVQQGWAKLPPSFSFGYTHGIEVDSNNNVYVFHTGNPSVVKFDEDGNYLGSWGDRFEGGAHGFYLHKETDGEYFYITDTNRRLVIKTTLEGEVLLEIGTPDRADIYSQEAKYSPTDVCVGPNGDIYIADGYGQSWIHQYDAKGGYIRSWGGKGTEPGRLKCPHGISVNLRGSEPELYVADRGNNRIQVFTMTGEFKRMFDNDMDHPCNFYFFGDEMVFPDLHSRVTIFDKNDQLITHLGEDQKAYKQKGWPNLEKSYYRPDRFSSPHGVCVDSKGNIYVAEWIVDGRITKLVRVGN